MSVRRSVRRFCRADSGTASLEFVLVVPVLIATFLASFESGLFMIRKVALERGLDMMVRDLRVGLIHQPTMAALKDEVCRRTILFKDCAGVLRIELTPVDMARWTFPETEVGCVDRSAPIKPDQDPFVGAKNQVMLIRACVTLDAMFPSTGIGLGLPKDPDGGYFVTATSGFVNEP